MKKKVRVIPHTSWAATSLWIAQYKTISILLFALSILGIGDGLIVLSGLGSTPWTVLSQGIAIQTNFDIGWSSFLISCAVMLVWKPLKLRLGLGTLLNIIVIALFLGITTKILTPPTALFFTNDLLSDRYITLWFWNCVISHLSLRCRPSRRINGWYLPTFSFKHQRGTLKP